MSIYLVQKLIQNTNMITDMLHNVEKFFPWAIKNPEILGSSWTAVLIFRNKI